MANITMYVTASCPYCHNAERLLLSKGVEHIHIFRIDLDPDLRVAMMEKSGRRTVPQIYINERHIGGFDDQRALDLAGELDDLLVK